MRYFPLAILLAASAPLTVADELVLPDRAYTAVLVTESARAFYILDPQNGSVHPVPKTAVAEEAHIIRASDSQRADLHDRWREKHAVLRNDAVEQKEVERLQSEDVQQRREYGLRMAQQDIARMKKTDVCFDRHDRRWQPTDVSQEALELLLSAEDEAALQLASLEVESQFVTQFVNMELAERVREAWLNQGWHEKDDEAREHAVDMVTAVVKREAKTSLERDATLAYIHRHVTEWK